LIEGGMGEKDKYLAADLYIAGLEEALEAHHLDRRAALEQLGDAVTHCRRRSAEFVERARFYTVAGALYMAKAKELAAGDWEHGGFKGWCAKYGVSRSTAENLAKIGAAVDPARALAEFRQHNREHVYDSIERRTGRRPGSEQLARIKVVWWRLTPEDRELFLAWASTETRVGRSAAA
jgi:hypothetical protein